MNAVFVSESFLFQIPLQTHPEEARLGISKLSAAAQRPAGDIIKIFVSKKDVR